MTKPSFLRRLLNTVCPYWERCGLYQNSGTCNDPTAEGGHCGKYREFRVENLLPKIRRSLKQVELAEETDSVKQLEEALSDLTGTFNEALGEDDKEAL